MYQNHSQTVGLAGTTRHPWRDAGGHSGDFAKVGGTTSHHFNNWWLPRDATSGSETTIVSRVARCRCWDVATGLYPPLRHNVIALACDSGFLCVPRCGQLGRLSSAESQSSSVTLTDPPPPLDTGVSDNDGTGQDTPQSGRNKGLAAMVVQKWMQAKSSGKAPRPSSFQLGHYHKRLFGMDPEPGDSAAPDTPKSASSAATTTPHARWGTEKPVKRLLRRRRVPVWQRIAANSAAIVDALPVEPPPPVPKVVQVHWLCLSSASLLRLRPQLPSRQ